MIRRIVHLAAGSAGAQLLGASVVFAVAAWLSPADFGRWAQATASMSILAALTNLGEVNAYLSSRTSDAHAARYFSVRWNLLLTALGFCYAAILAAVGQAEVGLLVVLVALNIPIAGDAALLYALHLRNNADARLVASMWASAVIRFGVSVLAAWGLDSPVALGLGMVTGSIAQSALLRTRIPRDTEGQRRRSARATGAWGVQSLSQVLPSQADYLVASTLTSPVVVGTYFIAYQATMAATAWLGLPLAKVSLSDFTMLESAQRITQAKRLSVVLVVGLGGASILVTLTALYIPTGWLGQDWVNVVPALGIIFSSLPARFLVPVADAMSLAAGRRNASILWNLGDASGTAVFAVAAVLDSAIALAVASVLWKVTFGIMRTLVTLADTGPVRWINAIGIAVPPIFACSLLLPLS